MDTTHTEWEWLKRTSFQLHVPRAADELRMRAADLGIDTSRADESPTAFADSCRAAYASALMRGGWPVALAVLDDARITEGLTVRSLSGWIEGRTTGSRFPCPSNTCDGWLVGVVWEDGQERRICTMGWHYDPDVRELRIVGGGEVSARFVTPAPLGPPPRPREEWPTREELSTRAGWSQG